MVQDWDLRSHSTHVFKPLQVHPIARIAFIF